MGNKRGAVEDMVRPGGFWRGKRVFVTGHTGFKGAWLVWWLHRRGAVVAGYSLAPTTQPNLFDRLGIGALCERTVIADINDPQTLSREIADFAPDVVLHLAAQAIVSTGYEDPVGTFQTNVMGTINVLEAVRKLPASSLCLVVTSDKCYENRELNLPMRESDPMGGSDPYSASKGACEVAVTSYIRSFFARPDAPVVATARAGNVIGGGDWSENRLLADATRAFSAGAPLVIRNPKATRPFQHVLEPLSGYLRLVECLAADRDLPRHFNFGPIPAIDTDVATVADLAARAWGEGARVELAGTPQDWHEAHTLLLDSQQAFRRLNWMPRLSVEQAVDWTMSWYRCADAGDAAAIAALTNKQIDDYEAM